MTQRYFEDVKQAFDDFSQSNEAGRELLASDADHKTARALSKMFKLEFEARLDRGSVDEAYAHLAEHVPLHRRTRR